MLVVHLLSDPKLGFSLHRATHCTDTVCSLCQILHLSGHKRGNAVPKTVNIWNFSHKFALQGQFVWTIFTKFSAFVRMCRWPLRFQFGSFRGTDNQVISIFSVWSIFPQIFNSPLQQNYWSDPRKLVGWSNGTDVLYCHAKFGGIVRRTQAVDEKVWCVFCLSCFQITEFVKTEVLSSSAVFKTVIMPLQESGF